MTADKRIRIVVVDDQPKIRRALVNLLEGYADLRVVGEADNGAATLELLRRVRAEVLLLDLTMPDMDAVELIRRVRSEHPPVKILALDLFADPDKASVTREAGAAGHLSKGTSVEKIVAAIMELVDPPTDPDQAAFDAELELLRGIYRNLADEDIRSLWHFQQRNMPQA